MSNPRDYTVAWICALSTERVAAEAFLDEEHELPASLSPNDNNCYKLGKVGQHMVVIAVLPHGGYGKSSAASVATNVLRSFPNVRVGLMVGVGGGAPNHKNDIRLGDIVVGATHGGKSSVIQYDYGKAIQNQALQLTGYMNQSPPSLLAAVSGLISHYEGNGPTIKEAIEKALTKKPRLRKKYKSPGYENDKLYQSHIICPMDQDEGCPEYCEYDDNALVVRPQRTEEDDDPMVHYGVIASADTLMKDATIRDKLSRDHDVLCFEMEAAGLVNQFPCLIIRGICDYSDTHKNDEWQGYAAMVAAAYAKDLLLQIVPSRIENETKIADILPEVHESIENVREDLRAVSKTIHSDREQRILGWLTCHDYAISHKDIFEKAEPGTGQWFLDSEAFQTWLRDDNKSLFCSGNPGAGKSVMASIVVNHLLNKYQQTPGTGIAYIYYNYQRHTEQSATDILASLLRQLAQTQSPLPKSVEDLYTLHENVRTYPTLSQISEALFAVAGQHRKIFIVIDALDECDTSNNTRSTVLHEMLRLQKHMSANILATSRPNKEISSLFSGSLTQEISSTDDDIRRYLERQISFNKSFIIDDAFKAEIKEKVVAAADGMFLLAWLQTSTLLSQPTKGDLLETLRTLNKGEKGLDEHYDQAMKRIQDQEPKRKALSMKILTWIVHAKRPLTVRELQYALAIRENAQALDEDFIPEPGIMLSLCAGLVILDEESNIVRLAHYTTQEFLQRRREQWFKNADTDITIGCVTYLSHDIFGERIFTGRIDLSDYSLKLELLKYPLYDYAAHHWGHHALKATAQARNALLRFLTSAPRANNCGRVMMPRLEFGVPSSLTGLHLTAYFGLSSLSSWLLDSGVNADGRDGYNRTPLSYSAEKGQDTVVKLLLGIKDVNVNSSSIGQRVTPLMYAAGHGHKIVVDLLLERHGIRIDTVDSHGATALFRAGQSGHTFIAARLIKKGADIGLQDTYGQTVLSVAAGNGHESMVKLLLENGADPNPKSKSMDHMPPLTYAAAEGRVAIVKLLLHQGANPESLCGNGRTPLSYVAEEGQSVVAKILLDTGKVDPDLTISGSSYEGRTPLSYAAEKGHDAIAELLLGKCGVDPDSRATGNPGAGMTPLMYAALGGRVRTPGSSVVGHRIYFGLAFLDPVRIGRTRSSFAVSEPSSQGRVSVIKLLLDTGKVNINALCDNDETPLDHSSDETTKRLLRERGAKYRREL